MAINQPQISEETINELLKGTQPLSGNTPVKDRLPFPLPPEQSGTHNIGIQVGILQQTVQQPLPPPEVLEQYATINPKIVDAIIANMEAPRLRAEEEQHFRHNAQMINAKRNFFAFLLSHFIGGTLTLFAMVGAVYCAIINKEAVGTALAVTTIGSILTHYIKSKDTLSKKENAEKEPDKR